MEIEVLRIGQRVIRDDRVTTHVALVARSFGAKRIYMNEINPEINDTISKINKTWGGDFTIENITNWKKIIKQKKDSAVKIVHLTMYGKNINDVENKIRSENKILIIVGAEKVPKDIYDLADYNIAIGNQPHSEISALGVLLDRIQHGKQFESKFKNPERIIIPQERGKNVSMTKTTVNNVI
ncbi:tRNA -methyltransferase [Marine Group I thaumarchaeote SCGC AAA799-D07]|nr:tRNA -methyltransferase [Marine Group I thaumarchaeote SCGC AAA799-D07]